MQLCHLQQVSKKAN